MGRDLGIANRLRAAGLNVIEVDGWQTRGSATFNPRGGVDHHTAGSNKGNAPSLGVCIRGRAGLPGPLCNVLQGFDGTAYVVASGRANHAGPGSWKGLIGNSSVYGVERENDGHSPQRPGQQESAERLWAALLGDIDASLLCGHLEWAPRRKIDFHDVNYGLMRNNVRSIQSPHPPVVKYKTPEGVNMFIGAPGLGFFAQVGNVTIPLPSFGLDDLAEAQKSPTCPPVMILPEDAVADFARKTMAQTANATK